MTQKGHHASGTEALYPDFYPGSFYSDSFYYARHREALQPCSIGRYAPAGAVGMLRRRHYRRLPERHRNPQPQRYEREGNRQPHPHRNGH